MLPKRINLIESMLYAAFIVMINVILFQLFSARPAVRVHNPVTSFVIVEA